MMAKEWRLERTMQCDKCPWKVSINPLKIPNGYSIEKHQGLRNTISDGSINITSTLNAMACHESKLDNPVYCIGWIENQLGVGNNIALRLKMYSCVNADAITTIGEQHLTFEDTLPDKQK
jgi:hypothetical protein